MPEQAQRAAARGEQLTGELADLGWVARLGERGRTLRAQIAAERDQEHAALAAQHRQRQQADTHQAELDQRLREWEHHHPGAFERHHTAERQHQLAELRRPSSAM